MTNRSTALRKAIGAYWEMKCPHRRSRLSQTIYDTVPQEHVTITDTPKPQLRLCHLPSPEQTNPKLVKQ